MNEQKKYLLIVGFGPVAGYKYSRCIRTAIDNGEIISYSIIDLESQKDIVKERVKDLPCKPDEIYFLPDYEFSDDSEKGIQRFDSICRKLKQKYDCELKVIIATEPQSHEIYLNYCISNNIDSLVTKPITIPISNGVIAVKNICSSLKKLLNQAENNGANHSVLCLSRHHEIYNYGVQNEILLKMREFKLPITSLRLNTSSGVWNLNDEFEEREDHPYKYGYGMLFHGAYHYIDLIAQFLLMNRLIYFDEELSLELSSYSAFPIDQKFRIPKSIVSKLDGFKNVKEIDLNNGKQYGETDIVTSFCLKLKKTKRVITLGTITLEQTTPGMRSWFKFPKIPYNINGRLHCTELDAKLSTLFSVSGYVVKIPISAKQGPTDLRGKNIGTVIKRSNAVLIADQEFYTENTITRPYGNSFSYSAETEVFNCWIKGIESKSSLSSHLPSVLLLEALAESSKRNGKKIVIDFSYEFPSYLKNSGIAKNDTYNKFGKIQFAAYDHSEKKLK